MDTADSTLTTTPRFPPLIQCTVCINVPTDLLHIPNASWRFLEA